MTTNDLLGQIEDELSVMLKLVQSQDTRKLPEMQLNLMIQHRYEAIISHHNKLVFSRIDNQEYYSKKIDEFQYKLTQIFNKRPPSNNGLVWYELEMLRLMFINILIGSWGEGGILRLQGQAYALVNILSGIELVDVVDILVPFDHPEYMKRSRLAINMGNHQAGIYYLAATLVYSNTRDLVMEWSARAIQGNQMVLDVIDRIWDLDRDQHYHQRIKEEMHLRGYIAFPQIIQYMIRYLILVFTRIGGVWPHKVSNIEFLDVSDTMSFLRSLLRLAQKSIRLRDELQTLVDAPNSLSASSQDLQYMNSVFSQIELGELVVEGFILVYKIWIDQKHELLEELDQLIVKMLILLEEQFRLIHNDEFIGAGQNEVYYLILEYMVYFCYVNDLISQTGSHLWSISNRLEGLLQERGMQNYPNLVLLTNLAQFSLSLKRETPFNPDRIASIFEALIPQLRYQPREALTSKILSVFSKVFYGQSSLINALADLEDTLKEYQGSLTAPYLEEMIQYLDYLKGVEKGRFVEMNLRRIEYQNVLDPYSVIIPDLSQLTSDDHNEQLVYLPFNLGTDYAD